MLWPLAVIPVATISNKWLLVFFLGFPPNTLGNWGLVTLNKICSWTFCLPLLLIYHQFKKKMWLFFKSVFYFLAVLGLQCCVGSLQLWREGDTLSSWRMDLSLWWLFFLCSAGSRVCTFSSWGSQAPEHRRNSCAPCALLLHSMWDFSGPGIEPVSPVPIYHQWTDIKKNNFVIIIFSLMKTLLLLVVPCGV